MFMIDLVCNILRTVIDGLESEKSKAANGHQFVINIDTLHIEHFHTTPDGDDAVREVVSKLPWKRAKNA